MSLSGNRVKTEKITIICGFIQWSLLSVYYILGTVLKTEILF